jgi:hypothetical protein
VRQALLYLLAAVFLALIVSVAWWTREVRLGPAATVYEVQSGDTPAAIAERFEVSPAALAEANEAPPGAFAPRPGDEILIPAPASAPLAVWGVHGVGLVAEVVGVLMSFWLALVAGLLPARVRGQILGIGLVLGLASYAAGQAVAEADPRLTPQFVFESIKDGFTWAAAFPLFARAFGVRDDAEPPRRRRNPTRPSAVEPEPVPAEPEDGPGSAL